MAEKVKDNNNLDESIKSLKGADRVRLRPGVMFGSDNIKGAFHTFKAGLLPCIKRYEEQL